MEKEVGHDSWENIMEGLKVKKLHSFFLFFVMGCQYVFLRRGMMVWVNNKLIYLMITEPIFESRCKGEKEELLWGYFGNENINQGHANGNGKARSKAWNFGEVVVIRLHKYLNEVVKMEKNGRWTQASSLGDDSIFSWKKNSKWRRSCHPSLHWPIVFTLCIWPTRPGSSLLSVTTLCVSPKGSSISKMWGLS